MGHGYDWHMGSHIICQSDESSFPTGESLEECFPVKRFALMIMFVTQACLAHQLVTVATCLHQTMISFTPLHELQQRRSN